MEALKNLGIDWKLLLAQVGNFVLLLLILKRYAYKPFLKLLDDRAAKIEQGLRDAEVAEEKLAHSLEEEKKILVAAREEARTTLVNAEANAKKCSAEMIVQTKEKIDKMITEADAHLAEEQKKLLREAKAELATVVVSAVEKVLHEKVDAPSDRAIVEKVLQGLAK